MVMMLMMIENYDGDDDSDGDDKSNKTDRES
jgi:hypothetical protein